MGRKLTNEAPCEQLNAVVPQFTVEVVNTTNDNTFDIEIVTMLYLKAFLEQIVCPQSPNR
jgi:hypothetical protein